MTNPASFRRASSSRNADSRAVSATPLSGSSNVWKRASNMGCPGCRGGNWNGAYKSTLRQRLPQFGIDCASIYPSALDRGKRFAVQVVLSRHRGTTGSVSTRRRGDAPCLLFRLRKFRRRLRTRRSPRRRWCGNNPASSSRCWIALSRPASGAPARERASPNRNRIDIGIHSFEFRRLHQRRSDDARALDFADDVLIRPHDSQIEFLLCRNQNHSLADDDQNRDVAGFSRGGPLPDLAAIGLLAPRLRKARIAPDFDAVCRNRQYQFRFARLPLWAEPLVDQPQAAKVAAFCRPFGMDQATVARAAVPAPCARWFRQRLDRHHLAAQRTFSAALLSQRGGGHRAASSSRLAQQQAAPAVDP